MGADQQFCLRWNNFHTNITSAFESLRDDEDFVDITLACEGKQIKAHKMVLSACSPYFRSLLKGNPCQHPIVFLKDVTFANLTSILDFMYHGEVNVSHNELATFLKTAESLKVRGLAEDEKKKEAEGYNEASSPPPPRDPPDPVSPRGPGEEVNHVPDTHNSDSPPPPKRQRRRSEVSIHSTEDTNETVLSEPRDNSVKNEPQDYIEDDADILIHSDNTQDIKQDIEDNSVERNFGLSESVTISRSQAAMQQLQESFGSFLPGMGQSPGFLPHGATDMPRPPPYSLEGVQGLPPGISALPGPSMSQGAASQDASQGEGGSGGEEANVCRFCWKVCSNRYNLKKHERDLHFNRGAKFVCDQCNRQYSSLNSLQVHRSNAHPTGVQRRRIHSLMHQSDLHMSTLESPMTDHHMSSQLHQTPDLQRTFKSEPVPYRSPSLPPQVVDLEDFESNTDISQNESSKINSLRPVGISQEIRSIVSQGGSLPVIDGDSGANPQKGSISRGTVGNPSGVNFLSGSRSDFNGSPRNVSSPLMSVSSERIVEHGIFGGLGEHTRLYSPLGEQRRNQADVIGLAERRNQTEVLGVAEGRMSSIGLGMWQTQGSSYHRGLLDSSTRNLGSGSISSIQHAVGNNISDPMQRQSPALSASLDKGTIISTNSAVCSEQSPTNDTSKDVPFYMKSLIT